MIGRSLVIFQRGNNKNELHEVNSWNFAFSCRENDLDNKIVSEAKKKKWKPEEIVNDAEVEAIVNATNCIGPQEPGYHKWASDGVHVINLSGDPTLPNPATVKAEKRRKEGERRHKAYKKLDKFIPELIKLRNAIPTGTLTISKVALPKVTVKLNYGVTHAISMVVVLDKDGQYLDYASWLVDNEALAKRPELVNIVNCPHRKAYRDRCQELADLLGLSYTDIENTIYEKIIEIKNANDAKHKK